MAAIPITIEVYQGDALVKTEKLNQETIKIGKISSANINLEDESVSRLHAQVEVTPDNQVTIVDLNSTKGTFVNGARLGANKPQKLSSGDEVKVGDVRLVVKFEAPVVAAQAPAAAAPPPRPAGPPLPGMRPPAPFGAPAAAPAAPAAAAHGHGAPAGGLSIPPAYGPKAFVPQLPPQVLEQVELRDGSRAVEVAALYEDAVIEVRHFDDPKGGKVTGATNGMIYGGLASLGIVFLLFLTNYITVSREVALEEKWEHENAAAAPDPLQLTTMNSTYPRLLADIGGTNARFGLQRAPGDAAGHVRQLRVADHAGPAEAAEAYLAQLAGEPGALPARPCWAAIAVATPVTGDRIAFTNSAWAFSRTQMQAALGLDGLLVLNDFEALAMSLPVLGAPQMRVGAGPQPALPVQGGTLAVVGPGTGLGVGAVVHAGGRWVPLPGEGGHVTVAPADDLESELLAVVRREYPHVSAERLLAGIGIPLLYRALGQVLDLPATAGDTAAIVSHGLDGSDALASRTIDQFCAILGGVCGNAALTLGARGGVFIGGGIVPRFAERFFASQFRARFEAKGRFEAYLKAIPTPLITDTLAALSGTALAIDQAVAR